MTVEPGRATTHASPALVRWGALGWATVGVVLGVVALLVGYRWLSGLIVPVAAALVLAVMTLPLTNWLDRYLARGLAVFLVLLLCAGAMVGLALIFIHGVAEQASSIEASLKAAVVEIEDALGVTPGGSSVSDAGTSSASSASAVVTGVKGVTGWLATGLESLVDLFFGVFIATMTFFLVLLNPKETQGWVARLLPWPREQADRLFSTSGQVIFDYYKGCTLLAFVNAIPIWIVARVLGIDAAGSILVVLFVSSYIPYIGAWIGGAFAVLMAVGSGGTADGWIMLVAVLVVNLGLQSAVQPFAFGATMKVSPLGVFLFTLFGALVAGVFGAMMAAPAMALITRFNSDVRLPSAAPTTDPLGAERADPLPSADSRGGRDGYGHLSG
jgi:predicted PurR-regulated permease PerM